ncbi:MAG: phospholipase A1 [Alphaproteobacteria bacterium]|jgi:phospholipase A1
MRRSFTLLCNLVVILSIVFRCASAAQTNAEMDVCLLKALKSEQKDTTIEQLRDLCATEQEPEIKQGLITKRILAERQSEFDAYVITPHKMNYILPISVTDGVNFDAYSDFGQWAENLEDAESKFQISFKVPLNHKSMLIEGDGLYAGFTLQSWWQVYSQNISKPFRETNYQPEVFYIAPLKWSPLGSNTGIGFGFEHQSNGRSQLLSRSWNRLYFTMFMEKGNFAMALRPWWRLPEDDKIPQFAEDGTQLPFLDDGDDNPDIGDYMGHFELSMAYAWDDYELSFRGRQNFAKHRGGAELGFTFPLLGKLRGYFQYTAGYGESLIDYNYSQQRIGIGFALTNAL